jgi:hypothetical protein
MGVLESSHIKFVTRSSFNWWRIGWKISESGLVNADRLISLLDVFQELYRFSRRTPYLGLPIHLNKETLSLTPSDEEFCEYLPSFLVFRLQRSGNESDIERVIGLRRESATFTGSFWIRKPAFSLISTLLCNYILKRRAKCHTWMVQFPS